MRKTTCYFALVAALAVSFATMLIHSHVRQTRDARSIAAMARMTAELGLTDLCLFTEASYTRHLSQTDLRTPFQELPLSLEHFPSGSLVTPPVH